MAFSPYVHRYSNNARLLYPYNSKEGIHPYTLNNFISLLNQPDLSKVLNKMQQVSGIKNSKKAHQFFRRLGDDIQTILDGKSSTLNQNSQDFPSVNYRNITSSNITDWLTQLDNLIDELNKYIEHCENFIYIDKTKFESEIAKEVLTDADVVSKYKFLRIAREKVRSGTKAIKTNLSETGLAQYTNLYKQKQFLEQQVKVLENRMGKGAVKINKNTQETILHTMNSAVTFTDFLKGAVKEVMVGQKISEYTRHKIPKMLKSMIDNPKYLSVQQIGTNKSTDENSLGSVSKGDVSLNIGNNSAKIITKIPISIKSTKYEFGDKNGEISIHTGTSIERFIDKYVAAGGKANLAKHALVNIMMWGDGEINKFPRKENDYSLKKGDKSIVYNALRKVAVIDALAGSLQGDNFAYYFIVNKKVYSMYDILHKILLQQGDKFLAHALSTPKGFTFKDTVSASKIGSKWDGKSIANSLLASKFDMKLKMNLFRADGSL